MELDANDVKELFKSLGSIETGQNDIRAAVGNVQKDVRALQKQALDTSAKKVSWKQLMALISAATAILFSAMGLHYETTKSHADDTTIHIMEKGK